MSNNLKNLKKEMVTKAADKLTYISGTTWNDFAGKATITINRSVIPPAGMPAEELKALMQPNLELMRIEPTQIVFIYDTSN